MTTDTVGQATGEMDLVAAFRAAAPETRERKFWITLVVALTLHALILLGVIRSAPRIIGDPNSKPDAVSVSFVTEAELKSAETGSEGGPPPTPPATQSPPPQPPQPQQQQQAEQPPQEAQPPPPKAEPPPKEPPPEEVKEPAPERPPLRESIAPALEPASAPKAEPPPETKAKKDTTQDLAKELPDLLELPDPKKVERPAQKEAARKQQQKTAMRTQPDMTLPPSSRTTTPSFDGRSAGVERPAGITRSGANDDFARRVVQALRQTMPQMSVLGQVTVRILINENGNIASVEVVARSENTDLNRAVVFSTKQASFPFPPNGSTVADRTFTITYIYN